MALSRATCWRANPPPRPPPPRPQKLVGDYYTVVLYKRPVPGLKEDSIVHKRVREVVAACVPSPQDLRSARPEELRAAKGKPQLLYIPEKAVCSHCRLPNSGLRIMQVFVFHLSMGFQLVTFSMQSLVGDSSSFAFAFSFPPPFAASAGRRGGPGGHLRPGLGRTTSLKV